MSEFTVRPCNSADIPALAELWQRTFGDTPELTDEFYRLLPDLGIAFAAFCGSELVGETHLMTDLALVSGAERSALAYLYAVAVDERFRGKGLGAALVGTAEEYAEENGLIFCTQPAETSLFDWYARISGLKHISYCAKRTVPAAVGELEAVSAAEYLSRRDALLGGRSNVRPGSAAMEFAEAICRVYHGGLFASDAGIIAAYPDKGVLKVSELVGDEALASAAANRLGLPSAEITVNASLGAAHLASAAAFPPGVLWQMTFD